MTKGMEAARFRLLLEQLRDEGKTQTQIAALVGIDQTLVSKIINGQRDAGLNSISKAAERLALDREFFFAEVDGIPNYRDYLAASRSRPAASEPRVDREEADALSPDEEEDLAIVQKRKGLTDDEVEKLRAVRRSIGPMDLEDLLRTASTIVANRTGKAVDRGQVAETKVPGNLKPFGARKPKR